MKKNKNINVAKLIGKFCEVVTNDSKAFSGRLLENYNGELYFIVMEPTVLKLETLDNIKSITVREAPKSFIY